MRAFLTRARLTLKQHRFETMAIAIVTVVVVVGGFVTAYRLNAIVFPKDCEFWGGGSFTGIGQVPANIAACQEANNRFYAVFNEPDVPIIRILMVVLPFLAGLALGAPLVAREIEHGTAPLSWALAGSRVRWLLPKFLAIGGFFLVVLAAIAVTSDVLFAAANRGADPNASFQEYQLRGPMVIGVGLLTFTVSAALGTMLRRTLPAIVATLIGCVVVLAFGEMFVRTNVLAPMAVPAFDASSEQAYMDSMQNSDMGNALQVDFQSFVDGKRYYGDPNTWWNEHQPEPVPLDSNGLPVGVTIDPNGIPVDASGNPVKEFFGPPAWKDQLIMVPTVIEGSDYWIVVAVELGCMLGAALLASGAAFFVINRRRPY